MRTARRLLGALAMLGALVACSSGSEHTELTHDIADETVPGNLPTAPPPTSEGEAGLTPGANRLLSELDGISQERDLCAVLSGAAFEGLFTAEIDTAGLVTNPAGLTRLVAAVNATFDHIIEISPPEVAPAMETVKDMVTRVASLDQTAGDLEEQVNAILTEPPVVGANRTILDWGTDNCTTEELPDPGGTGP